MRASRPRYASRISTLWLAGLLACACSSDHEPDASALHDAATSSAIDAASASDGAVSDAAAGDPRDAQLGDASAGSAQDAAVGEPIDTPPGTWTWLPIDGALCANGSPTGVGVKRSASASKDLVLTFEGGGACWDGTTCFTTKTAVHVDEDYDAALFASDFVASTDKSPPDPNNPLSTASAIFFPYCTGDLHAGTTVQRYQVDGETRTVHHAGAHNVDLALARIRSGLPTPDNVWVIGSSAGGYGATLNLQQIGEAFPKAKIKLLADSSPFVTPTDDRWPAWKAAWKLRFPTGCTACSTRFGAVIDTLAAADPKRSIGLLSFNQDATIAAYFGFDAATFESKLNEHLSQSYGHDNTHYFIAEGTSHVMLGQISTLKANDGAPLSTFVTSWALGLSTWTSAH